MVSADPDEHTGGHTYVIDDLVWLTVIVLVIVLLTWACCTVCSEPQPMQQPCRQCHSTCGDDPVLHITIDDPCKKQCSKKHKSALTTIPDEGDTAPSRY